ncbi:MAG: ChaN family lipoprotein, partial [Nitrospiraceae bacterium]
EEKFIPIFLENWGFGWSMYRNIFLYAREHSIPLVGLNVPEEITKKVGRTGFLSLTDEEREKLPPGVTCELDQEYMDHLVEIFQLKGRTDKSFYFFCEAQVLWDQAMAWYLTDYMKNHPKKTVIVLAGAIHAWKYGIPKHKERYISGEQRIIVPDLPVGSESIREDDTDYLVIHS